MSARFLHERGHVANHQVKLKKKEEIAEGTMAFSFEKPGGFQFHSLRPSELISH